VISAEALILMLVMIVVMTTLVGGAAIHVSSRMFGGPLAAKRGFGSAALIAFATLATGPMLCNAFRSDAWPFFVTLVAVVPVMLTYRVNFVRGLVITCGAWMIAWVGYGLVELFT
jgi:hypothetical protein